MKSTSYNSSILKAAAFTAVLAALFLGILSVSAQEAPKPAGLQGFQSLGSQGSLQGVWSLPEPMVPAGTAAPDISTRSSDWIFSDMNELMGSTKPADPFSMLQISPSGGGQSPVEKYYDNLGQTRAPSPSPSLQLMNAMGQPGQSLNSPAPAGSSIFDRMFSPAASYTPDSPAATAAANLEATRRMNFEQLLSPGGSAPASVDPMAAIRGFSRPTGSPVTTPAALPTITQPHPNSLNPVLGIVDPTATAFRSQLLVDPTIRALGAPVRSTLPDPKPVKSVFDTSSGPQRRKF